MARIIIKPQPVLDEESGYVFDGKYRKAYKDDSILYNWRIKFINDWSKFKVGHIVGVRGADNYPRWIPSILLKKDAFKILLKVTDVKIERLQDISEEEAKAEGVQMAKKWPTNPLVWVISFKKI